MKIKVYNIRCIFKMKSMIFAATCFVLTFTLSGALAQNKSWVAPLSAKSIKNPFSADKSAAAQGKTLYIANCAPCHGNGGKGDGPAAAALNPKPANHTSAAVQGETNGSLYWKLTTGHNPMPSYKTILTDKQRWALVSFIRTLATKK